MRNSPDMRNKKSRSNENEDFCHRTLYSLSISSYFLGSETLNEENKATRL